jgi:hypothetical protein
LGQVGEKVRPEGRWTSAGETLARENSCVQLVPVERVDNLGAYRMPPETGILIPSDYNSLPTPSMMYALTLLGTKIGQVTPEMKAICRY